MSEVGTAPVRVAFVQSSLTIGGAERLVQALAMGMDRTRITPLLVHLYAPGTVGDELAAAGIPTFSGLAGGKFDPGVGGRLRAWLARERVDVVYAYDSALPMFWAGWLRRATSRPRLVLGFHSTGRVGGTLAYALADRMTLPVADRFVALADSHRRYLEAKLHLPPARIDVIVSGVDLARFHPPADRDAQRAALGLPVGVPLAGIVAALRPEKHHALLLAAAVRVRAQLPEARFVIVGDGPERAAIAALIARLGLGEHVLLLGARGDIPELWRALDVAVLCSHPIVETLPVTLLEAHASGVPAVATDVGSVRDVVADGTTGLLVPPGDDAALASALVRLLGRPAERARMGVAARARAEARFDRGSMLRQYADLFVRVAGGS